MGTSSPVWPSMTTSVVPGAAVATTGFEVASPRGRRSASPHRRWAARPDRRRPSAWNILAMAQESRVIQTIRMRLLFEGFAERAIADDDSAGLGLDDRRRSRAFKRSSTLSVRPADLQT